MKISELSTNSVARTAVVESWMSSDLKKITACSGVIFEMSNLKANITDLPANIVLWTRPQPLELPHDKYRIKVTKDHKHTATYSVSSSADIIQQYRVDKRYRLDAYEEKEIKRFIIQFYPLLISYIDAKLNDTELEYEIQKINK